MHSWTKCCAIIGALVGIAAIIAMVFGSAQWATAYGTVFLGFVALLALFWPQLQEYRRRPVLKIRAVAPVHSTWFEMEDQLPDGEKKTVKVPMCFVHVLIANEGCSVQQVLSSFSS